MNPLAFERPSDVGKRENVTVPPRRFLTPGESEPGPRSAPPSIGGPEPVSGAPADRRDVLRRALITVFSVGLVTSISLAEIALGALALVLLASALASRRPRLRWPLAIPIAAFAGWTLVSAVAAQRPAESLWTARHLLLLATIWIVLGNLPDRPAAHRFVRTLFLMGSVVGLLAIVQVLACPSAPPSAPGLGRFLSNCDRARGFFSIYMTLAGVLMALLLAMLPRLIQEGARSAGSWAAWFVGAAALALSYVRGAWVGFTFGLVGCLAAMRRRALAVAAVGLVIGAMAVLLPGVLNRARTIGTLADPTTRDRVAMLKGGLRIARERLFLGIGVGQVKRWYPAYAPPEAILRTSSHLHNTPLQILVERGIPGLVAWLAIFAEFFVRATRIATRRRGAADADRWLTLGCIAAVTAFLVAGLFEYNFGDTEVLLVVCSLIAVPFALDRDRSPAGPDDRCGGSGPGCV